MESKERAINAAASQLSQVNDIILAEKSPAAQRQALEAQQAQLKSIIDEGGPKAQRAIIELIKVDQHLLPLVKQSDNRELLKDMLDDLERFKKVLEDQLKRVIDGGGPHAQWAITELIKVDQQVLQLGKQLFNLKLQQDTLDDLERLKKVLEDQLFAMTGQTDPLLAELTIAREQEA